MLRFIYGDYTSDKTDILLNMINKDTQSGIHTYLIVPDQEALQIERLTLAKLPPSSQLNLEVLGFSRLYECVCRKYGNICYSYLTEPMRYLLMWKALHSYDSSLAQSILKNQRKKAVALEELFLSTIKELKINGITAEALDDASNSLKSKAPELAQKIRDVSTIYSLYTLYVNETYSDSADDLTRLAHALSEKPFFENCSVYIDSFTSFTPVQHKIIEQIFKSAANVTVTFPVANKKALSELDAKSIRDSHNKLFSVATKKLMLKVESKFCSESSQKHEDIKRLSKELWDFNKKNIQNESSPSEAIFIEQCENVYSVAEALSSRILTLMREGARCSDMVIIARDAEAYRGIIDQALRKSDIPFYFADGIDLCSTAAVKFILSALRIKVYGWQANDVISHIKTGFCGIDSSDSYLFEEYVTTWNIKGNQFKEAEWTMQPDGYTVKTSERGKRILDAANRVRASIVPSLNELFADLDGNGTVDGMCKALYRYMIKSKLEEQLAALSNKMAEASDFKASQEFSRLYGVILSVLAETGKALSGMSVSVDNFIAILRSVFAKTELNTIPTSIDEVTVASADTVRTANPKYAFIIGLCEGEFPANVKESGMFSASDKEMLAALDIEFNSNEGTIASDELLYVKRSFSAPNEKLYLFTHKTDFSMESNRSPSLALIRAQKILPITTHSYLESDLSYLIPSPKSSVAFLRSLTDNSKKQALKKALLQCDAKINANFEESLKTSSYTLKDKLNRNGAIFLSPSTFESYVNCPFNYFCMHSLKLRENKVAKIGSNNIGDFIHGILESVIKRLNYENKRLNEISDDYLEKLVDAAVEEYFVACFPESKRKSKKILHLYSILRHYAFLLLKSMKAESAESSFKPQFCELKLDGKGKNPPSPVFILDDGTTVTFNGTIDKLEIFKKNGKVYLKIMDYKTGNKRFDLADLEKGLNIQMLLYLLAVSKNTDSAFKRSLCENGEKLVPAGVLYLASTVNSPVIATLQEPSITEDSIVKSYNRSGILLADADSLSAMSATLNSDYILNTKIDENGNISGSSVVTEEEFNAIFATLEKVIKEISTSLNNGVINAEPINHSYKNCDYCAAKLICRNIQRNQKEGE